MKQLKQVNYIILILLTLFLTITAFIGGVGILTGCTCFPLEHLEGSMFSTYTIPAVVLMVIVGGSALIATVMLTRHNKYGGLVSVTSGMIVMTFEFVEVIIIGSPPGIARNLQLVYFGLGVAIIIVSLLDLLMNMPEQQTPIASH